MQQNRYRIRSQRAWLHALDDLQVDVEPYKQGQPTKAQLRNELAEAVRNTIALTPPEQEGER